MIATFRRIRIKGGWKREGRTVKAVAGRAINKNLSTLGAFLPRAMRKGWIGRNPLENVPNERIKVKAVRVDYMPDDNLRALIATASEIWLRAFVVVAYYTGARRGDLLRLERDRDVDLDGSKATAEARVGPSVYIYGNKADTPHWIPLHPSAVQTLYDLRSEPTIDRMVFPGVVQWILLAG